MTTALAAAMLAMLASAGCKTIDDPKKDDPVGPVYDYKYSYSSIGNIEAPYLWEEGEVLDVCTADGTTKVGVATLESGAGQQKGSFNILTDLESGESVIIRRAGGAVSAEQKQDPDKPSLHRYLYGETVPIKLDDTWATTFTMPQECSVVEVEFKAGKGSQWIGCDFESVTLTGEGICGKLSGDRGSSICLIPEKNVSLSSDGSLVFPFVVLPSQLKGKDCSITLKAAGLEAPVNFKGRDIAPRTTAHLTVMVPDCIMTPAVKGAEEFTQTIVEAKNKAEAASYGKQSLLLVKGMHWMPKYQVNSLDRWGGYEGVKPDEITSTNPEGFWRTGKYKGRHVMVNPDGNVTILHGINGVCPDPEKEATSELSQKEYKARFASTTEWVGYANRILADYCFNFYSSNPNRIRRTREFISEADQAVMRHDTGEAQLGEVALAYLLRTFSWDYNKETGKSPDTNSASVFTLMFDPLYLDYIDALAADAAALYKNDPGFIGYYTDNELQFRFSSSSTPAIYLKQWLALDTSSSSPRANQYAKAYAEQFMRDNGVEPLAANVTTALDDAFLLNISEYYYRTTTEALRKHDPNHLILGSRLHGKPKTLKQVHQACAKYCDVISVNVYGVFEPNDDYFITQFKNWVKPYDKPCFVTEFYTRDATATYEGQLYGNTGEGGGWIVKGQTARGQHYQNFTRKLISYDHCIGWQWFQFTDDYRPEGWNNKGLITPKYELYDDCLKLMRELHWNIYQIMDYYHDRANLKDAPASSADAVTWD